jgi:transcriptional regulator of arginine metabolism
MTTAVKAQICTQTLCLRLILTFVGPCIDCIIAWPGWIDMKSWRQGQILDVVDHEAVASQEELRGKLRARGILATQATISRDLKEIGLVKRAGDGAYVRPGTDRSASVGPDQLRRAVSALLRSFERVDSLLVLRTDRGQAQGLAEWIDRAQMSEVAGTIAGDDTILLVCRGLEAAAAVERRMDELVKR